jgi:hypothetical protein
MAPSHQNYIFTHSLAIWANLYATTKRPHIQRPANLSRTKWQNQYIGNLLKALQIYKFHVYACDMFHVTLCRPHVYKAYKVYAKLCKFQFLHKTPRDWFPHVCNLICLQPWSPSSQNTPRKLDHTFCMHLFIIWNFGKIEEHFLLSCR